MLRNIRRVSSSPRISSNSTSILNHVTVTCVPGLEFILSAELRMLGIQHQAPQSRARKRRGEIQLQNIHSKDDLFRCCLYLGTATQVRCLCGSFKARGLPELRRKAANISWTEMLKPNAIEDGSLDIRVVSRKSKLYHTGAIRERVLESINQHFGQKDHQENDRDKENKNVSKTGEKSSSPVVPTVLLDINVFEDEVQIFVNAYPTPLHQRGYRKPVAKAPLREDLAFAMLFTAGWTPAWSLDATKATQNEWCGLVDPFCGSGTIAIEGAAMALGLPPGRLKEHSPFRGTVLENAESWSTIIRRSLAISKMNRLDVSISASDRDSGAVEATKINAIKAGVMNALTVQNVSLSGQKWFANPSVSPSSILLVTNPPFGKRISSKSSSTGLLSLFQTLCHAMRCLDREHGRRSRGIILTDNPKLLRRSGVFPFETSFKTSHGGIKVSAMKFDAGN